MNASNKISEAKKKREARNPINNSPINNKAQAPGTIMVLMSILTNNDKGHMFAEKLNKGETLSMEEFNEVLKHGAE